MNNNRFTEHVAWNGVEEDEMVFFGYSLEHCKV